MNLWRALCKFFQGEPNSPSLEYAVRDKEGPWPPVDPHNREAFNAWFAEWRQGISKDRTKRR